MDIKPRQFTERDKRLLKEYGREVMDEIAKRAPQASSRTVPVAVKEAPNEPPTNGSPRLT